MCDILPLPSVLCVFFDSAEKLVGIAPSSMSAAQNSLLSQLYPEILNAQTGYMNGTDVNTEELDAARARCGILQRDRTPRSAKSSRLRASARLRCRRTSGSTTASRRSTTGLAFCLRFFRKTTVRRSAGPTVRTCTPWCSERVKDIPDEERARAFFLFQYNDSTIMTSGQLFLRPVVGGRRSAPVNVAERAHDRTTPSP